MTTQTLIRRGALAPRLLLLVLAAVIGGFAGSTVSTVPVAHSSSTAGRGLVAAPAFGYPVKPFHQEHPIRAFLGDPRMVFAGPPTRRALMASSGSFSFHQGVDISAPDGTAVYPVESGTVSAVSREWVRVSSGTDAFEYWHILPLVSGGARVDAYSTVLGHILRNAQHVHLTEYEHGRVVNPLAPGRLGPYTDTTPPQVRSISIRSGGGSDLLPGFVRGRVQLVADAFDLPTTRVPGIWQNMPTGPALLTWEIRRWTGKVVVRPRVAVDFRSGVPANSAFWRIYARGTYQNMAVFGPHYSFLQPGDYLYRLTPDGFDTKTLSDGVYDVTVTATDVRGNHGSLTRRFTIHNRPGWIGS
jgi:hypothetical protein